MKAMLFCNIGWMAKYGGYEGQSDKIVNGGKWVKENGRGHEVCNFVKTNDGYVYGFVSTWKKTYDRQIKLESIGGSDEPSVSGVDVIWTATPTGGGRRVVGWYRNAVVFRDMQELEKPASLQHKRDDLTMFRVKAKFKNIRLLPENKRVIKMPRGKGWMGTTPWWVPPANPTGAHKQFIQRIQKMLDEVKEPDWPKKPDDTENGSSPSTASKSYLRYVEAFEVRISPRHHKLQRRFESFLVSQGATEIISNDRKRIDVSFVSAKNHKFICEIKRCDKTTVRYAVRMAIGQLLDYRQKCGDQPNMLIVLERKPDVTESLLASSNGFALAYPKGNGFEFIENQKV